MGGYGSGRGGYYSKKDTVEECLTLSVASLIRLRRLRTGWHLHGSIVWSSNYTKEVLSTIGIESDTTEMRAGWVRLYYTRTRTTEQMDYRIRLTATRPNFGGVRWWFICPLVVNGRVCARRVAKLYLPPSRAYFGCRHCHDLTYTSCQESHKFDSMYAGLARDVNDKIPGITGADVKRLLSGRY